MNIDSENLYTLSPEEFEKFCADVLVSEGYENVKLVGGRGDQGVDIICQNNGRNIVVQVKHTKQISYQSVQKIIGDIQASTYSYDDILLITSAIIPKDKRVRLTQSFPALDLLVFDREDILERIRKKTGFKQNELATARRRTINQRLRLFFGISGAAVSILGVLLPGLTFFVQPEKPHLQERIEKVELALDNLKSLESHLDDIKKDMVKTEQETKAIQIEYEKAKELEKLTEAQYESINKALGKKPLHQTLFDYGMGLVFGVAGSLIASVISSKAKQNRALRSE